MKLSTTTKTVRGKDIAAHISSEIREGKEKYTRLDGHTEMPYDVVDWMEQEAKDRFRVSQHNNTICISSLDKK